MSAPINPRSTPPSSPSPSPDNAAFPGSGPTDADASTDVPIPSSVEPAATIDLLEVIAYTRNAIRVHSAVIFRERDALRSQSIQVFPSGSGVDSTYGRLIPVIGCIILFDTLKEELINVAEDIKARETTDPIEIQLTSISEKLDAFELSLAPVSSLLERACVQQTEGVVAELRDKFASVSESLSTLRTAERLTRSQMDRFRYYLLETFVKLIDTLPSYSSEASIRERISAAVDSLRDIVVDCRNLQDDAESCIAEVLTTWHIDQDVVDRMRLDILLKSISRQLEIQEALQSLAFRSIENELRDAEDDIPATIPSPGPGLPIAEFSCAVTTYEELRNDLARIHDDHALLVISLDEISLKLASASMAGTAV
ncbi:hypothetical protein FKP32DRAFT_1604831 [Trametes sanguinea]|nr:hypothetical protein FKP32DRAFT_1604831 [Trametes sanguinea]